MSNPLPRRYCELENKIAAAIAPGDQPSFNNLCLEVYEFQREFNGPYDAYCRSGGGFARRWREIPALPQSAFKLSPLRTFSAELAVAAFHTSGTTGEGHGIHEFCSLRLYDEAILQGWDLLRPPVLPQILLVPGPDAAPHSSLSYMMGRLGSRAAAGQQQWLIRADGSLGPLPAPAGPVMVLGTALAFLHLCETTPPLALPTGSMAFETGGYKGSGRTLAKEELYLRIEGHLGIPAESIINEYGMTELSSQCYSRGLGQPHLPPPWMRALVIDPATGDEVPVGGMGVLRLFDLANLGSVMAIQTRDLAIRREEGFELLGRDPAALPRGCSISADQMLRASAPAR